MEPIVTRGMSNGRAWTHTTLPNGRSTVTTEGFGTVENIPQLNGLTLMRKVTPAPLELDRFDSTPTDSEADLQHRADMKKLQMERLRILQQPMPMMQPVH